MEGRGEEVRQLVTPQKYFPISHTGVGGVCFMSLGVIDAPGFLRLHVPCTVIVLCTA